VVWLLLIAIPTTTTPLLAQQERVQPGLTGKERLTGKAADQQRVNDCKVPPDKRGNSARPDDCSHIQPEPATEASPPNQSGEN